ncbi:MAG: NUDIX hydrolase [Phycisphaerae bacterium]
MNAHAAHVVYESKKFRIERQTRRAGPDAPPVTHDVIVHPGAAVILPLLADGRVVLIRNERLAAGGELLELPAGTLEPPETPAACAARELAEETGYRAERWEPLLAFFSAPGFCSEYLHVFLATELTAGAQQLRADERIRTCLLAYDEALNAIRERQIRDAKTIAALLYYDRFARTRGNA